MFFQSKHVHCRFGLKLFAFGWLMRWSRFESPWGQAVSQWVCNTYIRQNKKICKNLSHTPAKSVNKISKATKLCTIKCTKCPYFEFRGLVHVVRSISGGVQSPGGCRSCSRTLAIPPTSKRCTMVHIHTPKFPFQVDQFSGRDCKYLVVANVITSGEKLQYTIYNTVQPPPHIEWDLVLFVLCR